MKLSIVVCTILLTSCLLGCPKNPPNPPPTPDASDASAFGDSPPNPVLDACQLGCAALVGAGCPLGDGGDDCANYMRDLNTNGKEPNPQTRKPLTCADVAAVKTKDDARRLGFVCP
jgi:hypothetical protein